QARRRRPGARLRRHRGRVPAPRRTRRTGGPARPGRACAVRGPGQRARGAGGRVGGETLRILRRRRRPARAAPASRRRRRLETAPARRHPQPGAHRRQWVMAEIPEQDVESARAVQADAARKPRARLGSLHALWPFVLRHKGLLVAWLVSLAASSTATLSLPLVVRRMIDHGFSGDGNINATFALVFAVALALALAT